jgi:epoxyqueuosine reductase
VTPVLLHVCCGPCAAGVLPLLRAEGLAPRGFFANPNIHPSGEWIERLHAAEQYAGVEHLPLDVEPTYGVRRFVTEIGPLDRPERCERCFAMRMELAAEQALRTGIARFTTTLLVSPYQDRELLCEVGERVGRRLGVEFLALDFRSGFREGQQRARGLGLYRQSYCGCVFSEEERYRERLARERVRWEPGSHSP